MDLKIDHVEFSQCCPPPGSRRIGEMPHIMGKVSFLKNPFMAVCVASRMLREGHRFPESQSYKWDFRVQRPLPKRRQLPLFRRLLHRLTTRSPTSAAHSKERLPSLFKASQKRGIVTILLKPLGPSRVGQEMEASFSPRQIRETPALIVGPILTIKT